MPLDYSPLDWNNNDPNTPASAERVRHLQDGIVDLVGAVNAIQTLSPFQVTSASSRAGLDPTRPVMFVTVAPPPIGGVNGALEGDVWERA